MENNAIDLDKLCRLCLSDDSEKLHHIFKQELSNKIIILSGLEIQSNDALPKNICKDCRYNLEKSYYLRMVAKQSDARLRKHIRLVNQNKRSQVLLKNYKDDDTEEFDQTFTECYKYFGEAYDEINLLRRAFESEKERIVEEAVKKAIEEYKTVSETSTPLKKVASTSKNVSENPIVLNKCAPTRQRFENSPNVHRRRKADKQNVEVLMDGYELKMVEDSVETEEYEFRMIDEDTEVEFVNDVDFDGQVIDRENEESDEEYNVSIKKPSKRKSKDDKPAKQEFFEDHSDENYFKPVDNIGDEDLDENGEKKIFQCAFENCVERFARRQACKTHFFNHLASKTITKGSKCEFCQKTFKVESALERHKRVHTKVKPFKCDFKECNKAFSQKEMLKRHKVIHLSIDDAPFACNYCDKKFRQKEPLKQHINKAHSEDAETKTREFSCQICQKQFAHSSGLSRHLLIHSGRKFICKICDKVFNDQSALKRHGNVHSK